MLISLLEKMSEGVHVVDHTGVTVQYNSQAGLTDGLKPAEVLGRHLLQVFPSLSAQSSSLLRVLATGEPVFRQQQTFTNYKGERVTTINTTWPILQSGELIGAIEISQDVTQVRQLTEQVVQLQAKLLRKRKGPAHAPGDARYTVADLVGNHPLLVAVKEKAVKAAQSNLPVLVYGETGTGKELLVQAIHNASSHRIGPLVAQNCAALPEGLLEGILFGTARGSFTGAENRPGLFELAHGGTLYLDEINSMDSLLQAKLLRVLQDGRLRRVGDIQERAVDVRIIASANEDPEQAVAAGRLRQDLYYRINVIPLELPPLRERRADIPLLVRHFLHKHGQGQELQELSRPVNHLFQTYHWPGNVRELEHVLEAALHIVGGSRAICLADLPVHLQRAAEGNEVTKGEVDAPLESLKLPVLPAQLRGSLIAAERAAVATALAEKGWNLSQAARQLGIPRQTLQYRMRILGLQRGQDVDKSS